MKRLQLVYFQVRESPTPLNIPTPTPAPDRFRQQSDSCTSIFVNQVLHVFGQCKDIFQVRFGELVDAKNRGPVPLAWCCIGDGGTDGIDRGGTFGFFGVGRRGRAAMVLGLAPLPENQDLARAYGRALHWLEMAPAPPELRRVVRVGRED